MTIARRQSKGITKLEIVVNFIIAIPSSAAHAYTPASLIPAYRQFALNCEGVTPTKRRKLAVKCPWLAKPRACATVVTVA